MIAAAYPPVVELSTFSIGEDHCVRPAICWTASLVTAIAGAKVVTPDATRDPGLPFAVLIVEWKSAALDQQRQAYQREAGQHEVVFCIESWRSVPSADGIKHVVVERVRREHAGGEHGVRDVGNNCLTAGGKTMPMVHTHSDGNCQFSPSDLVTVVGRGAAFEGIQCGDHYFVWTIAWQVVAMANECRVAVPDDTAVSVQSIKLF